MMVFARTSAYPRSTQYFPPRGPISRTIHCTAITKTSRIIPTTPGVCTTSHWGPSSWSDEIRNYRCDWCSCSRKRMRLSIPWWRIPRMKPWGVSIRSKVPLWWFRSRREWPSHRSQTSLFNNVLHRLCVEKSDCCSMIRVLPSSRYDRRIEAHQNCFKWNSILKLFSIM